jgi:alpha-tubulin suppressor-like RCC1 family protein
MKLNWLFVIIFPAMGIFTCVSYPPIDMSDYSMRAEWPGKADSLAIFTNYNFLYHTADGKFAVIHAYSIPEGFIDTAIVNASIGGGKGSFFLLKTGMCRLYIEGNTGDGRKYKDSCSVSVINPFRITGENKGKTGAEYVFTLVPPPAIAAIVSKTKVEWKVNGLTMGHNSPDSSFRFSSALSGNFLISAFFVDSSQRNRFPIDSAPITISVIPSYALFTTVQNGIVTKTPAMAQYDSGSIVSLKATPANGFHFVNWSGDLNSLSDSTAVLMDGPKNITANFEANAVGKYALTVSAANGTVIRNPDKSQYDSGTVVGIKIQPNSGYRFASWTGDASGSADTLTVTMTGPKKLTAQFIAVFPLTINSTNGAVTKSPDQALYDSGTVVTLTAASSSCANFTGWGGALTVSKNPATITMSGPQTVTATFTTIAKPTITIQPASHSRWATDSALFSVAATTASGTLSYKWKRNGTVIPGATGATYSLPSVNFANDNGAKFTCLVGNGCDSIASNEASLTVDAVVGVAAGMGAQYPFSLFLKADGTVWGCGGNQHGLLGDSTIPVSNPPVVPNPVKMRISGVKAIAAGYVHSLMLKDDGTVWACGDNSKGELGDGTNTGRTVPVQVIALPGPVKNIAAGMNTSLFLLTDGSLYACGDNSTGEFGNNATTSSSTPVLIKTGVQNMVTNGLATLIISITGNTLFAAGYNGGQFGNGKTANSNDFLQISSGIKNVGIGAMQSYIVKNDTAWASGINAQGELGRNPVDCPMDSIFSPMLTSPGHPITNVKCFAGGENYCLVLKNDGTLWGCGANSAGQLGDGSSTSQPYLIQVASNVQSVASPQQGIGHSLIIKTDGTLWGCGYNSFNQLIQGTDGSHLTQLKF